MLHLLFLLAAMIDPPHETVFDDWAVACDNVRRCEATALQAPEQFGDAPAQVLLSREAGAGGATEIAIDPGEAARGPIVLLVDGRLAMRGTIDGTFHLKGAEAERLARLMTAGSWLELRTETKTLTRISLAGVSDMLRFIDTRQARAGTVGALLSSGAMDETGVPAAAALPTVPAVRAPKAAAETPSRAVLGELAKLGNCDLSSVSDDLPVERYRLDAQATLVLIPCGSGAYNFNSAAFILRGGKGAPAEFDVGPDWIETEDPATLTNASFTTTDGGVLSSSSKGRGLGDCGTDQRWVWDGSRFRMIVARVLGECRGSINWLTVFRATPAWR